MRHTPPAGLAGALIGAATLVIAVPSHASTFPGYAPNHTFADGSKGFAFTSTGGFTNPAVLVEFNPQPDPPGFGASRDLTFGGGRVTQISTPTSNTGYGFLIALLDRGSEAMLPLPPAPNADGNTAETFMADGSVFRITMNFAGPASAADWAAFNPQPEPPGVWFGAQFDYPTGGDPVVTFEITENERPLTLSLASVPEPASWAMMVLGVFGIGAASRARNRPGRLRASTFA